VVGEEKLTPSIPRAALANSDEVNRKYNRIPFLRRQKGGIESTSMDDTMPSVAWAAAGAMITEKQRLQMKKRR
jgi:hypothetical protein